jgi:hypothetical protein
MPTTTKMGIVYPASTDLVKDGATAMGTISTTVDAKTGLVFLSTTSFTGVSSISLPAATFNANYDTYKIIFDLESVSGTNPQLSARLRASGTDASGSNYLAGGYFSYKTGGIYDFNDNSSTSINLGQTNTATYTAVIMDLINPFATKFTNYLIDGTNADSTNVLAFNKSGSHNLTTSYDSVSFIVSTGTFAGSVSVFGFNK